MTRTLPLFPDDPAHQAPEQAPLAGLIPVRELARRQRLTTRCLKRRLIRAARAIPGLMLKPGPGGHWLVNVELARAHHLLGDAGAQVQLAALAAARDAKKAAEESQEAAAACLAEIRDLRASLIVE